MARVMDFKEFIFFISARTPSSVLPIGRTDRLMSARMEPSCILQSDTPMALSMERSFSKYATTSSAERKSGLLTISRSGMLERL